MHRCDDFIPKVQTEGACASLSCHANACLDGLADSNDLVSPNSLVPSPPCLHLVLACFLVGMTALGHLMRLRAGMHCSASFCQ